MLEFFIFLILCSLVIITAILDNISTNICEIYKLMNMILRELQKGDSK